VHNVMRTHGMLLDFIRTWYSRSAYLTRRQ